MKRTHLSLAIGLLVGMSAMAQAQQGTPEPANPSEKETARLDEIVVTARRREETLQEVPVAVSAFSDADLVEMQANNIDSLQGSVPNMNIVQGRGSASSVNVFIRGIGQPDALQTFDPGVGMYVDDVYYSRIQGALFKLYDVDHIEVLRGPQGTLYGKNSTGGAIKVVTRDPGQETAGSVEISAGSFGLLEAKAYAATPLSDTWGLSAAIVSSGNDGYVKDPDTGKRNSRLNPDDRVTQVTVPHLRIIDDALWDQVKARQGAMKTKNTDVPIWDRRRPKVLFSGLMACGCCGGGFSRRSESPSPSVFPSTKSSQNWVATIKSRMQ